MNQQDLSSITVYSDILTVLKERGFSDAEMMEIFAKLTAQAEMEVAEELTSKLTSDQLNILDSLPDNTPAGEIAEKLGIDGEQVDVIRAEKTAKLLEEMVPTLN